MTFYPTVIGSPFTWRYLLPYSNLVSRAVGGLGPGSTRDVRLSVALRHHAPPAPESLGQSLANTLLICQNITHFLRA